MDAHIMNMATQQIIALVLTDHRRFVILMGRSEGTKYAGFKNELIELLAKHLVESVNHTAVRDEFILRVLAGNFLNGILRIAENYTGDVTFVTDNVGALVRYHMAGIAEFY
jgi:hypothetical protein